MIIIEFVDILLGGYPFHGNTTTVLIYFIEFVIFISF